MRVTRIFIILFAVSFLLLNAGCSQSPQQESKEKEVKTPMGEVSKKAADAMATTESYTMEQKKAYEQELADKFAKYEQKISLLKEQMAMAGEESKKNLQQNIENLQAKVGEMESRTNELKNASGFAWSDMKKGLDKAVADLDKAFAEAMQNFQKKPNSY